MLKLIEGTFLESARSRSRLRETEVEIHNWFRRQGIYRYCLRETATGIITDVDVDIILSNRRLIALPIRFGRIAAHSKFIIKSNQLVSLAGCPRLVDGKFDCSKNRLQSLEGGPEESFGYSCNDNELVTLKGGPTAVFSEFECNRNKLISLEGMPKQLMRLECNENLLTNLLGLSPGAENVSVYHNRFTAESLAQAHTSEQLGRYARKIEENSLFGISADMIQEALVLRAKADTKHAEGIKRLNAPVTMAEPFNTDLQLL